MVLDFVQDMLNLSNFNRVFHIMPWWHLSIRINIVGLNNLTVMVVMSYLACMIMLGLDIAYICKFCGGFIPVHLCTTLMIIIINIFF